ncbi:MAG: PilZ domain-containing protein [Cyanobacteria bacterium]|nr:PilZ domain-containing protein [Cyanobacteriota bacterium]
MSVLEYLQKGTKIQVTVWESDEDEGSSFNSYILDYDTHRVYIDHPRGSEYELLRKIKPGYLVGVVMPTDANLVMFYPEVLTKATSNDTDITLGISAKTQLEVIQRRRYNRVEVHAPIELEILNEDVQLVHSTLGFMLNLSGGGMRFASNFSFEEGQKISVAFRLSDLKAKDKAFVASKIKPGMVVDTPWKFQGEVIFNQNSKDDLFTEIPGADFIRKYPYVSGIQFLNLSENHQALLVRECYRIELTQKRNIELS